MEQSTEFEKLKNKYKIALRYISSLKLVLSGERQNIKKIDKEITE